LNYKNAQIPLHFLKMGIEILQKHHIGHNVSIAGFDTLFYYKLQKIA
jgi:hypothetical protein